MPGSSAGRDPRPARRTWLRVEAMEERAVPSVTGTVWYDADGDGAMNGTEVGAAWQSVTLYRGGMWADSTSTDGSGQYTFAGSGSGSGSLTVGVAAAGTRSRPR